MPYPAQCVAQQLADYKGQDRVQQRMDRRLLRGIAGAQKLTDPASARDKGSLVKW